MENPGQGCIMKERGDVTKGRYPQRICCIIGSRKSSEEGLAIGNIFEQFEHKITLGLLLFLPLHGGEAGSQVALAVAMEFGAVSVDAEIVDDKFLAKLVVEVQQRHYPCFDKHE